ncbi:ABC transporter ATP-binding protein [Variovorax sp. N23]|uniref:ABC transporter ATP-binding protein n=1 Tax=Variovorax sp. N23 TaxID=2980555 RepID=UPI0021C5C642|nr:ATP-binding cassette domain-containing protein [Variovorax sp. N23]MCU4117701.1 ATP-binding cassette domain-containing protein [Variovorax sp. N23]
MVVHQVGIVTPARAGADGANDATTAGKQSAPALETRALTRRFGDKVVVDRLDLSVTEGEVFGLLGRNGAGKSTLIKMLTTLLPPSAGSASVEGLDVVRQATQVRAAIGYVPQALSADGELTGYENLFVFACLYDIPRAERPQRIAEALAFMDLQDAAGRLVATYSGGMIRRLEIAQSMLHRPRLLFLDEPTVGLDPVARDTVWAHIRELRAKFNTTIFMTTHYMEEAQALCSRFGILRAGRLVACGTLDGLRRDSELPDATLDALFAHYTGESAEAAGAYGDTADTRQSSQRLS